MHESVGETGQHHIAAQLFTITLSQKTVSLLAGCRGSLPDRPWGSEWRLSKILHRSFLFLLPLKLPKCLMSCDMHSRGGSCRSCPGLEKKKAVQGAKVRCCLHQKPRCEKITLQKDSVAAKGVQLASSSALRCLAVVFVESCQAADPCPPGTSSLNSGIQWLPWTWGEVQSLPSLQPQSSSTSAVRSLGDQNVSQWISSCGEGQEPPESCLV